MKQRTGMPLPNLQLARFSLGWDQRKLSKLSGVSTASISKIERGVSRTGPSVAKKLADALSVEVWQLKSNDGSVLKRANNG